MRSQHWHLASEPSSGAIGVLVVVILVLEFLVAVTVRGIEFTAVLFAIMSAFFAMAELVTYVVARASVRSAEASEMPYASAGTVLLIALVSSMCIAVLAGIFALPLLFNGGQGAPGSSWRPPSILGTLRTGSPVALTQSAERRGDQLVVP